MNETLHTEPLGLERWMRRGSALLGIIAAGALVVLMLATVVDVLARWITRASLPGMMELAETALVVSVFLGLAWTSVQGGHVAVTIVTERLKPALARAVSILIWALNTLILWWMSWALFMRAIQSTKMSETRFGLVQWPMWPLRWVIAIGLFFWAIVAVVNLVRVVRGRDAYGEEAERVLDV